MKPEELVGQFPKEYVTSHDLRLNLRADERDITLAVVDQTLKHPEVGSIYLGQCWGGTFKSTHGPDLMDACEAIGHLRWRIEQYKGYAEELSSSLISYSEGAVSWYWYLVIKAVQTSDVQRFLFYMEKINAPPWQRALYENALWIHAERVGGEILTVMKNRLAAAEIVR